MDAPDLMEEAARQRMARDEIGRLEEEEDGTVQSGPQVPERKKEEGHKSDFGQGRDWAKSDLALGQSCSASTHEARRNRLTLCSREVALCDVRVLHVPTTYRSRLRFDAALRTHCQVAVPCLLAVAPSSRSVGEQQTWGISLGLIGAGKLTSTQSREACQWGELQSTTYVGCSRTSMSISTPVMPRSCVLESAYEFWILDPHNDLYVCQVMAIVSNMKSFVEDKLGYGSSSFMQIHYIDSAIVCNVVSVNGNRGSQCKNLHSLVNATIMKSCPGKKNSGKLIIT
uniref:Uncharacterized protein n=1 Tax=Oryza sativa subsp. japonica TaxID=39947 RepID=Q6ZG72_ORYSJ|nr:hypothetical protein [Oryza sativa Japonica Group]